MAEWLIEQGIAEERALLVENGAVLAARIDWPDAAGFGAVVEAKLTSRTRGAKRGTALLSNGTELLIDGLPPEASEGASIRVRITRAAIAESGRFKRAQARPSEDALRPALTLAEQTGGQIVPAFPAGLWDDVFADGWSGSFAFAGGSLTVSPTPAMTLIDIDGTLPPRDLAMAAVPAIATAIRRLDLGGSIGIDFPSLSDKADRRAVDEALGQALNGWAHERTAMNGFGFVQLVARLERPSVLARIAYDRAGAAARLLLRRAEAVREPGALLLTAHPVVSARITEAWQDELARRTGRSIHWAARDDLALDAAFAQAVAP